MNIARQPELVELAIADPPLRWAELGFDVDEHGNMDIGGVRLRLSGEEGHAGTVTGAGSRRGRSCG